MRPREFWNDDGPLDWNEVELRQIREFLKDIADPRLEETGCAGKTRWRFYVQVLLRDGVSLARDILLFRSRIILFGTLPVFHFARLMATFGLMASALGGNLEEERDLKAVLIYTEET
jgi:hypothetical protein